MPLYALIDGQPHRTLKDGPRRASCAECGAAMRARTGSVRIWHWAHEVRNPHCEAARESEWHLAWKVLALDGTQEVRIGRRRADVLAPGGFAVEFQASALTAEEVHAREDDWAGQGGMVWVFKAGSAFRDRPPRIEVKRSLRAFSDDLVKPENQATLDITWSYAPERVRAARAPVFLDIGADELLFIGAWRDERPLTGYGWRVPKNWVVDNVLRGTVIPGPPAEDPEEVRWKIVAYLAAREAERQAERQRETMRRAAHQAEQRREEARRRAEQQAEWLREEAQQWAEYTAKLQERMEAEISRGATVCDMCGRAVDADYATELRRRGLPPRHVLCDLGFKQGGAR